jgi:hypothetical protein
MRKQGFAHVGTASKIGTLNRKRNHSQVSDEQFDTSLTCCCEQQRNKPDVPHVQKHTWLMSA